MSHQISKGVLFPLYFRGKRGFGKVSLFSPFWYLSSPQKRKKKEPPRGYARHSPRPQPVKGERRPLTVTVFEGGGGFLCVSNLPSSKEEKREGGGGEKGGRPVPLYFLPQGEEKKEEKAAQPTSSSDSEKEKKKEGGGKFATK